MGAQLSSQPLGGPDSFTEGSSFARKDRLRTFPRQARSGLCSQLAGSVRESRQVEVNSEDVFRAGHEKRGGRIIKGQSPLVKSPPWRWGNILRRSRGRGRGMSAVESWPGRHTHRIRSLNSWRLEHVAG